MRLLFAVLVIVLALATAGCDSRGGREQSAPPPESSAEEISAPETSADTPESEAVPQGPEILTLTVPEGYTLARIGMTLEEMGICSTDEFIGAAQTGDYSDFPLVAGIEPDETRCFLLEGYLFPDTYEMYSTEPPEAVIRRMLANAESKLAGLRAEIDTAKYTADEILTIASIIEKEAFGNEQMPLISSVLHNRLDIGMPLQCDVTITYVEGAIKPFITGDIDRYNSYYNTFKCEALPSGPICNPGADAIRAALSPAETEYFFFVTDADKNYYYSETWEGHLENIEKAGL